MIDLGRRGQMGSSESAVMGLSRFNPRPGMGSRITRTGRGQNLTPTPANSAPMKARITKFYGR